MNYEGLFPYADQPWVPTLVDVERMKAAEPDESPVDWRRFGWSALEVPQNADHVIARFDILGQRFLERYAYRMLNAETMEKWQVRLQNRFDEVVDMYERAYALYDENQSAMMKDVLPGRKISVKGENKAGGEDSSESKSKYSDTPDQAINDSDNYAGSITKNTGNTKYGRTDSNTVETVETLTGAQVISAVNDSIDGWRDIDTAFIACFENNFMNIWWY